MTDIEAVRRLLAAANALGRLTAETTRQAERIRELGGDEDQLMTERDAAIKSADALAYAIADMDAKRFPTLYSYRCRAEHDTREADFDRELDEVRAEALMDAVRVLEDYLLCLQQPEQGDISIDAQFAANGCARRVRALAAQLRSKP